MPPTQEQILEIIYANKALGKIADEIDEKAAAALKYLDNQQLSLASLRESILLLDKKLEVLPLVLADKLETLVEKRTAEAFEDLRTTLDEMRNKLWAIKHQIREATGSHKLVKEEEKEEGISVRKGKFSMVLPFSEGTLRAIKVVGYVLAAILASAATGGGIWALVDRIKHALSGG